MLPRFSNWQRIQKTPLQFALVAPFVLLIAAAVGLTGYLSFYNGQRAVDELSSYLQNETTSRIVQNLRSFLDTGALVNRNTQVAVSLGMLNTQDLNLWIPYLQQQIQSSGSVNNLAFGNAKGEYVGIDKRDHNQTVLQLSGKVTGFTLYSYDLYNKNIVLSSVPKYDPRVRPWYSASAQSGKAAWSTIYKHYSEPTLQIAASLPLFDSSGNLLGITTAAIRLSIIGDFLESVKIGQTGQTFIMERSGLLVATSTKEKPFRTVNDKPERISATESEKELTKATAQYLTMRFGDLSSVQTEHSMDFISGGKRYFLQLTPFQDPQGLNWLIAVVVPESDFMGNIYNINRNTIFLTLIALIIALGVGAFTAQWVTRPIQRLNAAAKLFAEGKWQQVAVSDREDELGELARSFNQMATQLRELFGVLERNVADLKQTGQELSESRQRYKNIFVNAPIGIYQATFEGKFLRVNPAMAHIFGYESPEKIMATITDIKKQLYVHPKDRDNFLSNIIDYGYSEGYETQFFCKDGTAIWVSITAREVYDDTTSSHFMEGFISDINARKLAENELKHEHDLLEKNVEIRTKELFIANQELSAMNEEFIAMNDELNATNDKLRDSNKNLENAYVELKNAQQQILQQEKMASVGQLAAGVAHEINNPMGFIISNLDSMQKYSDKIFRYITAQEEIIQQLIQPDCNQSKNIRASLLIDNLNATKKASKIEYILQDTGDLLKETMDGAIRVKNIVKDLKGFVRSDAESSLANINEGIESTINIIWNEIKYKASLTKDLGKIPLIRCYPGQLNQVFMNILVNAAQAIDDQGEIHVKTWADPEYVFVSIADTGNGIPAEILSRIFEPFFTTKGVGKGTGLGLSISYDIIKKHDGYITVVSESGKGTTFTIKLPAK